MTTIILACPLIELVLVSLQCLNERNAVRKRAAIEIHSSSSLGNPGGSSSLIPESYT